MNVKRFLYAAVVTEHLVGISEIGGMLGVTAQRAIQIASSYPDFPLPEVTLASGRVWSRAKVERWIRKHPHRLPGRPPRAH